MTLELMIKILGVALLLKGVWGMLSYFSGRGAKRYHFVSDETIKNNPPLLVWLKNYFIWRSSVYWVGTKDKATRLERLHLLILSLLQIIGSVLLFLTYL